MSDWTGGYATDIGYTFGYYQELNPFSITLPFLNSGVICPVVETACELGFGQGLTTNIHAAATQTRWYGTDFNPSQTKFAQELAEASCSGAKFYDESFAEFCNRTDLPDFDFICLHGIWSWISDENRTLIVDFIRRKLKVGGILYMGYNTLPGWAAFVPMRHLMALHANVMGAKGSGIVNRIDKALEFAERLMATNPAYARANPQVAQRLKNILAQDRQYVAQEYLNGHWHPMHFSTMVDWFKAAKVAFVCSSNCLSQIDEINLSQEQQTLLNEIPDPVFRESIRDFLDDRQFRREYWVKGARKLSVLEQIEALRDLRVVLVTHRSDVTLKVPTGLGDAQMSAPIYSPILDFLADNKPRTVGEIERIIKGQGVTFAQLRQAIMVLTGSGYLGSVQDDKTGRSAMISAKKLNDCVINRARGSGDINFLASPLTGGGVPVNRFQQLFLLAISQGKRLPAEWSQFVWHILSEQIEDYGKTDTILASAQAAQEELDSLAGTFAEKQLPVLKALQII